jgi:hypothetical protein
MNGGEESREKAGSGCPRARWATGSGSESPNKPIGGLVLATRICRAPPLTGAPIRTAQLGNRDKREPRGSSSPKPAVSGSDSPGPICQNPAESREFLGPSPDAWEESLPTQTQWRWGESGRTCLWGEIPVMQGNYSEFLRFQTPLGESGPRFPSISADVKSNSLCSRTGNSIR